MKLDYDQLLINENAYFFKLKRPLAKRDIELIFEESLKHKKGRRQFESKIRESFIHGPKEIAKISYDVFSFKKRPSFLEDDVNVFEEKFGLFLIVEVGDLLAVVRKNVSGIDHFYTFVEKIEYKILVHFLLNEESKFEKIVSNSMNAASNSLQIKTAEANDLKGVLSRFGTSKQIISSLRLDNEGKKSTVTINTSRVNSFNIQNKFTPAVLWMVDMVALIKRALRSIPQHNFVDSFAIPINYDEKIDDLNPAYLLIRLNVLKDEIDAGLIDRIYSRTTGKKIDLENDVLSHERLFELKEQEDGTFRKNEIIVKVREKYISVLIPSFKDIMIDLSNDKEIDLNRYINTRNHFLIVFDDFQYVYTQGTIFQDSKLLGDMENFLTTFIPHQGLADIQSEKGDNYRRDSTQFSNNSLFKFVEDTINAESEYLICDDMGVEWGDFISIGEDAITFFHLKHNNLGLSATNLEAVFGQAQKNFGFLQLTEEMIEKRRSKWSGQYPNTSIKRMRKAPPNKSSIDDLIQYVNQVSANPNIRRRIFVVVDFISKAHLTKMLNNLKEGKTFTSQGVIMQMLWSVHGLLALAAEQGNEFRILCRP